MGLASEVQIFQFQFQPLIYKSAYLGRWWQLTRVTKHLATSHKVNKYVATKTKKITMLNYMIVELTLLTNVSCMYCIYYYRFTYCLINGRCSLATSTDWRVVTVCIQVVTVSHRPFPAARVPRALRTSPAPCSWFPSTWPKGCDKTCHPEAPAGQVTVVRSSVWRYWRITKTRDYTALLTVKAP